MLALVVKELTSVLFITALDTDAVDFEVMATVLEIITEVDIFDILEGRALDGMGVAVIPITSRLTLRLAMFF